MSVLVCWLRVVGVVLAVGGFAAQAQAIGGALPAPVDSLETTPNYVPVDPPITAAQFTQGVRSIPGYQPDVEWSEMGGPGTGAVRSSAVANPSGNASALLRKIEQGEVTLPVDYPGAGTSLLGVPHAQTLYLGAFFANKVIAGVTYTASCNWEIFTSTLQATLTIDYGMSYNCNQAWIRGAIAASLGGMNRSDGSVVAEPLDLGSHTPPKAVDENFSPYKTVFTRMTYNRTFESQLQVIYGFLIVSIDYATNPGDRFIGQPGGAGAYADYSCSPPDGTTSECRVVTDPFTFIPTDNTKCENGDTCGLASSLMAPGYIPVGAETDCGGYTQEPSLPGGSAATNAQGAVTGPQPDDTEDEDESSAYSGSYQAEMLEVDGPCETAETAAPVVGRATPNAEKVSYAIDCKVTFPDYGPDKYYSAHEGQFVVLGRRSRETVRAPGQLRPPPSVSSKLRCSG